MKWIEKIAGHHLRHCSKKEASQILIMTDGDASWPVGKCTDAGKPSSPYSEESEPLSQKMKERSDWGLKHCRYTRV